MNRFISAGSLPLPLTLVSSVALAPATETEASPSVISRGNWIDIDLTAVPQAFRGVFVKAQKRLNRILRSVKRPVRLPGGAVVRMGVTIRAVVEPIDGPGKILGQAGPTHLLKSDGLPVLGLMRFDIADLARMAQKGQLADVILHEMMHVLGAGTLWTRKGLLAGAGSSAPRFTGAAAVRAYRAIAAGNPVAVPVEQDGGPGTRDGHWDEAVFGDELMTGYISGPRRPLSATSIAALADLGYRVDMAQADPFVLPSATALAALLAEAEVFELEVPEVTEVESLEGLAGTPETGPETGPDADQP